MCVNNKRRQAESSSGLEITHTIPIAVMILALIRGPSVCYAESTNPLSTYDRNSVSTVRQDCVGDTCCPAPYEIEPSPFWSYVKTKYSCCIPKAQRNRVNCCPYPLIPSKEPNMDPSFGPFCCDPQNGHCCSKLKIALKPQQNPEYLYSEPISGECCPMHDPNLKSICCPRPLQMVYASPYRLLAGRTPTSYPEPLCCSRPGLCSSIFFHYDDVPSPRFCSPRGFCCPSPYAPIIEIIITDQYHHNLYIDGAPQFVAKHDNTCSSPARICLLPQVPWSGSCIEQQFATEVSQQDTPLYDIVPHVFSNPDPSTTAASSNVQCLKNDLFRRSYGNPFVNPESDSVAIDWFVTSPYVQRSKLLNATYVREQIWTWPEVIIPFMFPITIVAISLATALPALLLGAICWALVFNFRFLWIKKVRMAIRWMFLCIEKRRRIIQDNYLPPEDQRKFHARDRYQLPKALQDSDRSDDDEPEDLRRKRVDVTESHWTAEEIDALGFDPDNIPVDWIYGDLLGNPSALRKEVKAYNTTAKASGRPMLSEDDETLKQLDFEEWLHFLCKGETDTNDDAATRGARLERKMSTHRYKARKKAASKRGRVRIEIKRSETIHKSHSTVTVGHEKRRHKSKSKNRKSHGKSIK